MTDTKLVADHYTHGNLVDALVQGIERMGKSIRSVDIDDLGAVDEFHIGGRVATETFLGQLAIDASHHILDVGCGLGGASRFAATRYGCRVTGVDLTREYIEAGNTICSWCGLDKQIVLEQQNATRLPYSDATFDRAYMLHVGMNIPDKKSLANELHRVLKAGGRIGIYDVMRVGNGDIAFPVPWASEPQGSSVSPVEDYRSVLKNAGFQLTAERNRRQFALEFFAELQAKAASADGPPPLGLHILMGSATPTKIRNMADNISRNIVAPVEIIAEKPA